MKRSGSIIAIFAMTIALAGCQVEDADGTGGSSDSRILIDGSSTVAPITSRVAELYRDIDPVVQVSVATSGTGGGFRNFVRGDTDMNDASRSITKNEIEQCRENRVEFTEVKVAIDGITVVVNPGNDFCKALTVEQLKAIWENGSTIQTWKDLDPDWPDEPLKLYGPDTESGTYDYFTEEVCGESGNIRDDYTASANDNTLVLGVSEDRYSLGYFGYAYFVENRDRLHAVGVSPSGDANEAIWPTDDNIESGKYTPLSRPLFVYVNNASLKRPEVAAFMDFYLGDGQSAVRDAGYVSLNEEQLRESRDAVQAAVAE